MTSSNKRIWSVREVLKHLDHPDRLRDNTLVAWQFRQELDPRSAMARLKALVAQTLENLPTRQRQIVQRCDFRGEAHGSVMSALAVSERHFYRERRAALEAIAAALVHAGQAVVSQVKEYDPSSAEMELCFADTAYQAGDLARALHVLRLASADAEDKCKRIQLECRLAELSCEAGAVAAAKGHISESRAACAELEDSEDRLLTGARIDATESAILRQTGAFSTASDLAARCLAVLRPAFSQHATVQCAEGLGLSSLVLSETDLWSGRPMLGRQRALQAVDALSLFDTARAVLRIRLRAAASTAFMFDSGKLKEAEFELEGQYRDAISGGLALEATLIAWRLSNFHRFAQSHHRAVVALQNLLPLARQLLPREDRAGMCLDLAGAYLDCGEPERARKMVAEANRDALKGGLCEAQGSLLDAEACLLERSYERALQLCLTGIQAMRRLNRTQSVVNGLRLQAEANYGLGNLAGARKSIGEALESIDDSPHPLVVARTHRSAARITGLHKHRRIADEIVRALRT